LENLNYLKAVANGDFLYTSTGLLDETHIRFFSTATICEYLLNMGYIILNAGYRPDFSLSGLRQQVEAGLMHNHFVSVSLGQVSVTVDKKNINQKFGQQILIAASNAK
jgi:hypothetical protein